MKTVLLIICLLMVSTVLSGEIEKKQYQVMREEIRKLLVAPDTAKWWAPVVKGDTGDKPDMTCEASTVAEDYWFASGQVDCSARVGNLTRSEWVVIVDKDTGNIVYRRFDDNIKGYIPTKSKGQIVAERNERQRQMEEAKEQKKIADAIRKVESDERIRLWKEKIERERNIK